MAFYWFLFAMWAAGAIQFARRGTVPLDKPLFVVASIVTAVAIGLRNQVGGDWGAYLGIYEAIYFQPLGEALTLSDPGYAFLNWVSAGADWGVWFPNLVCGLLVTLGLARLARHQPNPWLGILVAVPYMIIVVAMGYTRQSAAIGVICWALADASEKNIPRQIFLIAVATLFHKTAILFLPILLVPVVTRNFLLGLVGVVAFTILFTLFLGQSSDRLVSTYAASNYDSQGAAVRIAMNVVAGGFMLLFRKRMGFSPFLTSFWTICAILSLLSVVALGVLSASSGVDRLSLFLIPLQVVTFSRLPYALSGTTKPLPSILIGVLGYSFTVQFVWLTYATNAGSWLPYKSYLIAQS